MNADVIKKWIEALRSGKYTQTNGLLNRTKSLYSTPAGMCCLGVLCDLHLQEHPDEGFSWVDDFSRRPRRGARCYGVENDTALLSSSYYGLIGPVEEWAGLTGKELLGEAITWNDSGKDFSSIADKIEAKLKAEQKKEVVLA